MNGFWRLTVRDEFSAGHALAGYHGKCEHMHGHNFSVEVSVEGRRLDPATGMLIDFGFLKKTLAGILAQLDHKVLNDLGLFCASNPSSENIARYIGEEMLGRLASASEPGAAEVRLHAVAVSEKGAQTAAWICEF